MRCLFLLLAVLCTSLSAQADPRISPLRVITGEKETSYIATPINRYCKNPELQPHKRSHQDISQGRGNKSPKSPSAFFSSEYLNVSIEAKSGVCNKKCMDSITQNLIKSFGLWRSGCSRCRSEKLIAISVNGTVWIDDVTLDKWRYALSNNKDSALHDPLAASRMSLRPHGFQPVVNFKRVGSKDRNKICMAATRYSRSLDLRDAICSKTTLSCNYTSCLNLPLRIGKAKTCSLIGRIACGSPDRELALNIEDQKFIATLQTSDGEETIQFGFGEEPADLLRVLIHETGHWFGLKHEEETSNLQRTSIMQEAYDPDLEWCITEWNLMQVDNAVELEWSDRLSGEHGLIWKR